MTHIKREGNMKGQSEDGRGKTFIKFSYEKKPKRQYLVAVKHNHVIPLPFLHQPLQRGPWQRGPAFSPYNSNSSACVRYVYDLQTHKKTPANLYHYGYFLAIELTGRDKDWTRLEAAWWFCPQTWSLQNKLKYLYKCSEVFVQPEEAHPVSGQVVPF